MKQSILLTGMLLWMAAAVQAQVNFTEVATIGNGPNSGYYDIGFWNGDGYLDVMTVGNVGTGIPYLFTYDAVDTNFVPASIQTNAGGAKFGDFDQNGVPDIIMSETDRPDIRFEMNRLTNADVVYSLTIDDGTNLNLGGVVVLDFDNDGDDDFVVGEVQHGSSTYVFENNNMNFSMVDTIANYGGYQMVVKEGFAGDLDGDGYDDIAWYIGYSSFSLSISQNMGGTGQFTPNVFSAANTTGKIHLVDMDGDGDLDIVTRSTDPADNGPIAVFVNNSTPGNFSFTRQSYPIVTAGLVSNIAVGNFTADNNPDIAYFSGAYGDTLAIMVNVDMDFSSQVILKTTPGNNTRTLIAADFNQDGYDDLATNRFIMYNNLGSTENDWTITANAVQGSYSASADLGVKASASDGLDQTIDTPEPPGASGNSVRAWFYHPEYNGSLGDNYIADIQGVVDFSDTSKVWTMNVLATTAGDGTVAFDLPLNFELPVVITEGDSTWVTRGSDITVPFTSDGSTTLVYTIAVGDTTAPEITPGSILEGPAIWNNEINRSLTWTVTEKNSYDAALSVSYDGGSTWNALYSGVAESFDYNVPDSTLSYDVHFKITAIDAAFNEDSYTSALPVTIVDPIQQVDYSTGWHMAGSPFAPVDNQNSALAEAFRFNWTGFTYESTNAYTTGEGHWLGTYDTVSDIITGTISESDVALTEYAGWRMVSVPLFARVSVDSMTVTNKFTLDNVSFVQAIDSGWVTQPYAYNRSVYSVTSELKPFEAYWIGVLADSVEIGFPIHSYATMVAKENNQNVIELIVKDGNIEQKLRIGTAIERTTPLPPAAPNTSSSGLIGETTILGNLYIELPVAAETKSVTSLGVTGPDRNITIVWENETVSDDMIYTLNTADGDELDLTKSGRYTWNTANAAPEVTSSPISTSTEETPNGLPSKVTLSQNYPNPFNPATSIRFSLPESQEVTLQVFNMLGQQVQSLVKGSMPAGNHTVSFNAEGLSSGVYLYRIQTGNTMITKQMVLIK